MSTSVRRIEITLGLVGAIPCALFGGAPRASGSEGLDSPPAEESTLLVAQVGAPATHAWVIGSDDAFVFVAQGYGPDGGARAAIVVHDRRTGLWFEIVRAPTKGATFGRSPRSEDSLVSTMECREGPIFPRFRFEVPFLQLGHARTDYRDTMSRRSCRRIQLRKQWASAALAWPSPLRSDGSVVAV